MSNTVEIHSTSLQGTSPLEVFYPPKVTEEMLKNAQKSLEILEANFPQCNTGISLHAGEVIDTEQVEKSGVQVTSLDVPDIGYPTEFLQQLISRPQQLVGHIAWRLNSTLGLTQQHAEQKRLERLGNTQNLQPFTSEPFIRVSAESNPNTGKPDTKLIEDIA